MPDLSEHLLTISQLAVAFAGFASLATVLSRQHSPWCLMASRTRGSDTERYRTWRFETNCCRSSSAAKANSATIGATEDAWLSGDFQSPAAD